MKLGNLFSSWLGIKCIQICLCFDISVVRCLRVYFLTGHSVYKTRYHSNHCLNYLAAKQPSHTTWLSVSSSSASSGFLELFLSRRSQYRASSSGDLLDMLAASVTELMLINLRHACHRAHTRTKAVRLNPTKAVRYVTMLCHRWWHWWPCDAEAHCPLKPWWAMLHSCYPSTLYTSYPDTSVSWSPLLSNPMSFQSLPKSQHHVSSTHAPEKQVAIDAGTQRSLDSCYPCASLRCCW